MNARSNFVLVAIASLMVSGCVAYPYAQSSGTDDLMTWAQGAGGTTMHTRSARVSTGSGNGYGGHMNVYIEERASSVNIRQGVPSRSSGGPVVYIEKGQPDSVPVPASNPYSGIKIK